MPSYVKEVPPGKHVFCVIRSQPVSWKAIANDCKVKCVKETHFMMWVSTDEKGLERLRAHHAVSDVFYSAKNVR